MSRGRWRGATAATALALTLGGSTRWLAAQTWSAAGARTASVTVRGCHRSLDAPLLEAMALELRALGVAIRSPGELRVSVSCRPGAVRLVSERALPRGVQRCVQTTTAVSASDASWERTMALLTADLVRHAQRATPGVCGRGSASTEVPTMDAGAPTTDALDAAVGAVATDAATEAVATRTIDDAGDAGSVTTADASLEVEAGTSRDAGPGAPRAAAWAVSAQGVVAVFPDGKLTVAGVEAALDFTRVVFEQLGVRLALAWTTVRPTVATAGAVDVQSLDGTVVPIGYWRTSEHSRVGLGPLVRAGWTRLGGVTAGPTVSVATTSGWWWALGLRAEWRWAPWRGFGVGAGAEAGWVMPGSEVGASTREACGSEVRSQASTCGQALEAVAVRGPWVRLGLGVTWGP